MTNNNPQPDNNKPFKLTYRDYKKIEKIIEQHNFYEDRDEVNFNNMPEDEKEMLWKLKQVLIRMESARLVGKSEEKE